MSARDSLPAQGPRRGFLGKLAALGASAMLPGELGAQGAKAPARGKPFRIDVHHHLMHPGYLQEVAGRRAGSTFKWSPDMSLEDMDKSGIALSVLSLIQPSASTTDVEKGRRIARLSNEYGAQLARDHKGRFATFATLPLLDTDGALKEIGHALDALKAEGIGLMTSYQDKYLGDASFAPIWEELNRRKAVIYTHPLSPDCCRNIKSEVPPAVVEYATDTTRTIASLMFSGTAANGSSVIIAITPNRPQRASCASTSANTSPTSTAKAMAGLTSETAAPASRPSTRMLRTRKMRGECRANGDV